MKTQKLGFMSRLRNRKGFSLVEIAIVLVIIGIIIAAIVKGQDLMVNANAKKVISAVSTWRNLTLAYLDRNGRYPGDRNKDGIIGSNPTSIFSEMSSNGSSIKELGDTMSQAPANPIVAGGLTFYAYFGNVPGLPTTGTNRNIISLCKNATCTSVFTKDDLEILKTMDTALDGEADAGKGQFRSNNAAVANTPATTNVALFPNFVNYSTTGTIATWAATDITSVVWSFERPF